MSNSINPWTFLAGLGLFLFAISLVEDSLKDLAGRPFKRILKKHTNNSFKSILVGILSTAVLQSSSAVTLILLAFVGSGVIQFSNALGIIIGANLGTTFTGWIVSTFGFKFDIKTFIFPIIALGSLTIVFLKTKKLFHTIGSLLLGFGLLFFGLSLMKESVANFQQTFDPTLLKGGGYLIYALGGFLFTAIIQSSSATMVITLTALHAGLLTLESSAALVVGADLGTTITVVLGAIKGSAAKKRVAAAHFLFNIIVDSIALIFLPLLLTLCLKITGSDSPTYTLVLFHSFFNLIGIFIFLPFLKKFANFLEKKIGNDEQVEMFSDIDPIHLDTALEALSIEAKKQLNRSILFNLSNIGQEDTKHTFKMFSTNDYSLNYEKIKDYEAVITSYALKVQSEALSPEQSELLKRILSGVRNCSMAAKSIKDIQHNLDFFKRSSNDHTYNTYQMIIENFKDINLELKNILNNKDDANLFEKLASNLSLSERGYQSFIQKMHDMIREDVIPLHDIPILFNSNREVFNSSHLLILAIGEICLNSQQAEDLSRLPKGF
tara:strand:- start:58791 stop:60440 length:1650 start_codon:yes stop_codon:yes gene_type:complete